MASRKRRQAEKLNSAANRTTSKQARGAARRSKHWKGRAATGTDGPMRPGHRRKPHASGACGEVASAAGPDVAGERLERGLELLRSCCSWRRSSCTTSVAAGLQAGAKLKVARAELSVTDKAACAADPGPCQTWRTAASHPFSHRRVASWLQQRVIKSARSGGQVAGTSGRCWYWETCVKRGCSQAVRHTHGFGHAGAGRMPRRLQQQHAEHWRLGTRPRPKQVFGLRPGHRPTPTQPPYGHPLCVVVVSTRG